MMPLAMFASWATLVRLRLVDAGPVTVVTGSGNCVFGLPIVRRIIVAAAVT